MSDTSCPTCGTPFPHVRLYLTPTLVCSDPWHPGISKEKR